MVDVTRMNRLGKFLAQILQDITIHLPNVFFIQSGVHHLINIFGITRQPRSQRISLAWGNSPGIGRSRDPKIPRFRGHLKINSIIETN